MLVYHDFFLQKSPSGHDRWPILNLASVEFVKWNIYLTPLFFNVKHILNKIVTCTVHIKMYNIRLSKVLQGFLMQ